MSSANVDLVRRLLPGPGVDLAGLMRDERKAKALFSGMAVYIDPDFEAEFVTTAFGPQTRRGLEGLRSGWLDWLEPWAEYRVEHEEFVDLGDRVVVLVRDFGRRTPGAPEVSLLACAIWTIRDGRAARATFYTDRAEAFAAVGIRKGLGDG